MSNYEERRKKRYEKFSDANNNKTKKKEEEEKKSYSSSSSTQSRTSKYEESRRKRYEKFSDPHVDEKYISSFLKDSENYLKSAQTDYGNMNQSNSSEMHQKNRKTANDLRNRAFTISQYLKKNKDSIDKDSYDQLSKYIDEFGKSSTSITKSFRGGDRYYKGVNEYSTMTADEIAQKAKEKGNSNVAYYENDGTAVTWDDLHWQRSNEEKIAEIGHRQNLDDAYQALLGYDGDIKRAESAMEALSAPDLADEEQKENLEYIVKKYGIETEGHTNEYISQVIYELYMQLGDGSHPEQQRLKQALADEGYDWEDLEYYHQYNADKERAAELNKSYELVAKNHPVLATGASIVMAPAQMLDLAKNITDATKGKDRPANIYDDTSVNFNQAMMGGVTEKIDESIENEALSWIATSAYSGLTSANQSALTGAVCTAMFGPAGKEAASAVMGSQAAAQSYNESIKNGADTEKAIITSVIAGAAEAFFEYFSLSKLFKISETLDYKSIGRLVKSVLKNTAYQGAIEGSEEFFTTVTNSIADRAFNGDSSSYEVSIDRYMKTEGLSREEAEKKAQLDFINELAQSVVGGFIGGAGTGAAVAGTSAPFNYAQYNSAVTEHGQNIVDNRGYNDLRALAESVAAEAAGLKEGKDVSWAMKRADKNASARNVGILSDTIETAKGSLNRADIENSLIEKGMSKHQARQTAEKIIKVAQKHKAGEEISKSDYKDISKNRATFETYQSLISDPDSSIYTRNTRYANARQGITENEDGSVTRSADNTARAIDKVVHEVALGTISSQNQFKANTGAVEEVDTAEPMTEDDAAYYKGKTTYTNPDTGETQVVNVTGISTIKDGEMILKLDNGKAVSADDIRFSSEGEALVYSTVLDMGVNAGVAEALVNNFKTAGYSTELAGKYVLGMKDAYLYGEQSIPLSQLSKNSFAWELSKDQREYIYKLGQSTKTAEIESKQKAINEQKAKAKKSGKVTAKVGSVIAEDGVAVTENGEIDTTALSDLQQKSLMGIEALAKVSPLNFHIFQSEKVDGNFVATIKGERVEGSPNGIYFRGTNDIWIDLNAGNFGEGTMLWTAGHEISHYIKERSPAKWKAMADFLVKKLSERHDISVSDMLEDQIAKIAKREDAGTKTESQIMDEAYEELVADSLSEMLTDGTIVETLAEIKQQNKSLWQTIVDAIADLLKRWGEIIGVYKEQRADTREAEALRSMEKTFKKLQKMYAEAFAEANAVEEAIQTLGVRNLEDFAEAKNTDGEKLFQYRAMEADEAIYRDMLRKWGGMSDTQINNLFTTIDRAMDIIKDNLEVLDYAWEADIDDRAFSPVKANSDSLYKVSLDFSTLCRKRILQQTIVAELQAALEKPLTREEGIAIRDALIALQEEGRKIEVACALCYVESARMKSPKQIEKFLNNREKVLREYFASKNRGDMKAKIAKAEADARARLGVEPKAPLKSLNKKTADAIRQAKKDAKASYAPTEAEMKTIEAAKGMTVSDFTTPKGLESLAKNHPELFDAYTSYVRNATKSKGIENDTWWRAGDSSRIGDILIANMNKENGLRSQSWSDFQVIHILDYIAATIELSTRNAKEQAYSKVPDYVELMGQTGVMINMSLIPTSKFNGTLEYDSTEGMDYKKALELREKYPATAGTICIGVDNKQIHMLLADINIDYVIPYHRSGMAAHIRELMHIPTWSEYQDYQSESELSDEEAKKNAEKYGVKLLDKNDPNYHKHTSFSEWFDLEVAQQIAKMENKNPSDSKKQKAYGVMYGGYMAMQNAANNYLKLCAERGLAPKFSHEKADFTAEDNYWKLLIDRKMVNNATGEIIEQQTIKPIFEEGEVLRILNDELERYPDVKADQDYAVRKVTENFLSGNIKSGMSAEAIAKVMKKPVDNVTKTNIMASAGDVRVKTKPKALRSERNKAPTFYSHMGKVIDGIKTEKIGAAGVVPYLKGKGVKNEEIKWSGIEAFLEGKKSVTKAELQEFVAGSMLQIGEQMSSNDIDLRYDTNSNSYSLYDKDGNVVDTFAYNSFIGGYVSDSTEEIYSNSVELEDALREEYGSMSSPRWSQYKLDGGENYRELVFTMPNSSYSNPAMKAHWGQDAEGVLAHARIQDFVVDGKKMLFIEEIQSDWHNEGQKKGYADESKKLTVATTEMRHEDGWYKLYHKGEALHQEISESYLKQRFRNGISEEDIHEGLVIEYNDSLSRKNGEELPTDAPFKGNYHEYVLKRLIRMAAEEGYDSIGWTTADIQSDRWSDEYAEGYRIEYDQDIPKFLNKYGKKWGAKVGKSTLGDKGVTEYTISLEEGERGDGAVYHSEEEAIASLVEHVNNTWGTDYDIDYATIASSFDDGLVVEDEITGDEIGYIKVTETNGSATVWSMPITDSMKESVLYEGQALYSERNTDSNRNLLANALETTVQDEAEANKLKEYKAKIALIDAEQQKLSELNAQIREISFSKGERDTKKLKELRFEAAQTANRINTYDRQLFNLESTKVLKRVLEREKGLARKRQKQLNAEAMAQYREKYTAELKKVREKNAESRRKATEGRHKTVMKHKIKGVISELNTLFTKGNKEKNVKVGLQETVATAIASAELLFSDEITNEMVVRHGFKLPLSEKESAYASDYLQALKEIDEYDTALKELMGSNDIGVDQKRREYLDGRYKEVQKLKKLDKKLSEAFERERVAYNRITTETILKELASVYAKTQNSNEDYIRAAYDDSIRAHIENLAEYLSDEPTVRDMSLDSLTKVYKAYKMVLTAVKKANSAFKAGKTTSIATLANNTMAEVEEVGGSKTHVVGGKIGNAISGIKTFDMNNLKPVHFFDRIGSKTMSMLYENVRKGEDIWAVDITEAKDFKEKMTEKYGADKWDYDKPYTFKSSTGREFTLTLEQMMSLYAFSKREQAIPHLGEGGFVFDQAIETYKEKEDGKKSILKYRVNTATAYKVTQEQVLAVTKELGKIPGAIKFVDEMQDYLSTVMGAKGNEVTVEMYGVELFGEKFYFPLKSAKQYMFEQNEAAGEVKIKNSSFSKETKRHANNPIILSNFMDVWANHVNDMSMYHSFVLPLEDFNRVFNYNTPASEDMDTESVKQFIQNAYGIQANQYISQLLKDLNGGARVDPRESIGRKMVGTFKKAKVFGSASVVIQQPSAVARALAEIDAKYFDFNPKLIKHKQHWEELKKYAPVAIIKEMGHFDTDMGMSSVDYIRGDKTVMSVVDDIISKPAAYMDELTWVHIWTAVKRETMAKNKGLKGEEMFQKAGERFTEVITKTQVYDSVLSRSANMRSKSMFMNMLTSFMAEPTTSINMLENAVVDMKRGKKGKGWRTVGAVAASVILNSILVSFVYAARDDDEDETLLEKYLGSLTAEIADGFNPITYYPILKDIWSIAQGYEVKRSDMTLIDDLISSLKDGVTLIAKDTEDMDEEELAEHSKEVISFWHTIAGKASSLVGLPLDNIIRDVKAGANIYNTAKRGMKTSLSLIWDEVTESVKSTIPVVGWLPKESKQNKLYDAIVDGDTAYIDRLKSGYKNESAYINAVSKSLRENDPRIREAAKARLNGDMTLYKQKAQEIKGEGHFTQDMIVRAINSEMNDLDKGETSSGYTEKPMYTNADYYRAALGGDSADINAVKEYLIESGKKESTIESNFNSYVKDAYEKGEIDSFKAISLMAEYGGKTSEEADISIKYIDFKADYSEYADSITESQYAKYYKPIETYHGYSLEDVGIGIEDYAEYCERTAGIEGTDNDGDGKTDSGSKKKLVMQEINSLPLTASQKDALYFLNGWSAKTLSEAPWR